MFELASLNSPINDFRADMIIGNEQRSSFTDLRWANHFSQADSAIEKGDFSTAKSLLTEIVEQSKNPDGNQIYAKAIHNLGVVAQKEMNLEKAERYFERSLKIFENLGDRRATCSSYHHIGMIHALRGQLHKAEESILKAAHIREELELHEELATDLFELGSLAERRGSWNEAERFYRRALEINERLGNQNGISGCYYALSGVAQELGRYEESNNWLEQADGLIDETKRNILSQGHIYFQRGILAMEAQDPITAESEFLAAQEAYKTAKSRFHIAGTFLNLGNVRLFQNDFTEAETLFTRAINEYRALKSWSEALALSALGELRAQQGRYAEDIYLQREALGLLSDSEEANRKNIMARIFRSKSQMTIREFVEAASTPLPRVPPLFPPPTEKEIKELEQQELGNNTGE